ncbi:MAG: hypothetical protein J6Y78_04600 [Paludibacteraceae bacterium]|nr:hypothetical protein [Paludibacteraceae bacterium]
MYEVVLKDSEWWISKDGKIVEELGSFIDPISPKIIVEELNGEIQL